MNEQAGPACVLSVLIVGAFAVLLHEKDRGASPPKLSPPSIARELPGPIESGPVTPAPAQKPPVETTWVAQVPDKARPGPLETPARPPVERNPTSPGAPRVGLEVSGGASAQAPESPRRAARPRAAFTVVEPGETLADVADRIYGSRRSAESLWRANRDQLATLESPLHAGSLLRTP